ncbi:MAG: site-2 protease family protein [Phycisphaerae bacterium]
MHDALATPAMIDIGAWLYNASMFVKVVIGFSVIIFVHELGHLLAAKWVGVRVDRFSVGFGYRLMGFRKGEGFTFGNRPSYTPAELEARKFGETDYCFKALPIGGYVKMLGQDDIVIDEKTGEMQMSTDPRSFVNRPVGKRMIVVSAGVVFNLLFAAVALMTVFLLGIQMEAPVVGYVQPGSPAAGKIKPGDRLLEVNGQRAYAFRDLRYAEVLGSGPIRLKIERDGKPLPDELSILPVKGEKRRFRSLGLEQEGTTTLLVDGKPASDLPPLKKGDQIVATFSNGQRRPLTSAHEIGELFTLSGGKPLEFEVSRPVEGKPGQFETVRAFQQPTLFVLPAGTPGRAISGDQHILGFLRRPTIEVANEGEPAAEAGLKVGDVIVEWGAVASPTYSEILDQIRSSDGKPMRVVALRGESQMTFEVAARRPSLISTTRPRVGILFILGEIARPIVSDVVPGTPAAEMNLPRGSLLLTIDGQPVADWFEVVEALKAAAGRTVAVRYRTGADEIEGRLRVPSSVFDALHLSATARILAIDGRETVTVPGGEEDESRTLRAPDPAAIRLLLAERVGKTVKVRYVDALNAEPTEAEFAVRADNADPWQLRLAYIIDLSQFKSQMETVDAHGNPLVAIHMGVRMVFGELTRVYQALGQVSRQSTEFVAGPVGIIGAAMEQAKAGLPELLQFLAILSINLAVINFLPLPVMDGGLMVFLLIEKLKGKPLSIRTQMISTLVGLAVILIVGVLVTIQDVSRYIP